MIDGRSRNGGRHKRETCFRGHGMATAYVTADGKRVCRECKKAQSRRYYYFQKEEEGKRMADRNVKRLLDARTPLILATIDLGEVICTAMTKPNGEHDAALTIALAKVEAALTEVSQAWLGVPMHYQREALGGGSEDTERVTA